MFKIFWSPHHALQYMPNGNQGAHAQSIRQIKEREEVKTCHVCGFAINREFYGCTCPSTVGRLQSENDKLKELCERMAEALKTCETDFSPHYAESMYNEELVLCALQAYEDFKKGASCTNS
jgi:hypothetical protein